MEDKKNTTSSDSINESIGENEAFVDFDELDESIAKQQKERKEKAKAEIETEKEELRTTESNEIVEETKPVEKKAENKLKDKLNKPKKEEITEEKQDVIVPKIETVKHESLSDHVDEAISEIKEEHPTTSKKDDIPIVETDEIEAKKEVPIMEELSPEEMIEYNKLIVNSELLKNGINTDSKIDNSKEEDSEIVIDEENTSEVVKDNHEEEEKKKQLEENNKKISNLYKKMSGFSIYGGADGVPCYLSAENSTIKGLSKLNIPVEKIKPIANDDESLKKAFLDQYINLTNAKDSIVSDHRTTRVPLILSGYYIDIKDYSMGEIASIVRMEANEDMSFVRKFQEELVSIYNHIFWTSLDKENGGPISFDEWLKVTKFGDLNMLFYGAYDSTFPGKSSYNITCNRCHYTSVVEVENKNLCYMMQNRNDPILKDTFIRDVMTGKLPTDSLKKTLVYTKANTVWDQKLIEPQKIRVGYCSPSLRDIIEYLSIFEELFSEEDIDFEVIMDEGKDGHNLLTLYTLIRNITVPIVKGKNADGKNIISFMKIDTDVDDYNTRMENRRYIVKILKSLPESSFTQLFTGHEVAERKRVKGIINIIKNFNCENCHTSSGNVIIDMRMGFFIKAAAAADQMNRF